MLRRVGTGFDGNDGIVASMKNQRRHADRRKHLADVDLLVHAVQTLEHPWARSQADVIDERLDLVVVLHPKRAHRRPSLGSRGVHLERLVDLALIPALTTPPWVIRRPHRARRATPNHQCRSPLGIGSREQDAHCRPFGNTIEGDTLRAHGVHYRPDIIHARLQTGSAGDRIGHPRSALVEPDEPREGPQVSKKLRKARQRPLELHVGHEAGNEEEVERAVAKELVGDVDVATQRVPRLGLHRGILTYGIAALGRAAKHDPASVRRLRRLGVRGVWMCTRQAVGFGPGCVMPVS